MNNIQETNFKISDISRIFRHLTTSLYRNPLESAIIEIVSNAQDAMISANKPYDPFIMRFNESDNTIMIRDFGIGMSPEFMENRYLDFGFSSKVHDENTTGKFGIGRLSVLAYTNNYFVYTFNGNIKRTYFVSSNEDNTPGIIMISSEPTNEPNGVAVVFKLKDYFNELYKVRNVIENKLYYFANLILENINVPNDYKLLDYKNFKFCNRNKEFNILHGYNVYPIDQNHIHLPNCFKGYINPLTHVSIKFDITDPIEPTPSRTDIKWDSKTIKLVQEKVDAVIVEFTEIINNYFPKTDDFVKCNLTNYNTIKMPDGTYITNPFTKKDFFTGSENLKNYLSYHLVSNYYFISGCISVDNSSFKDILEKEVYLVSNKNFNKYVEQYPNKIFIRFRQANKKSMDSKEYIHFRNLFYRFAVTNFKKGKELPLKSSPRKITERLSRKDQVYGKFRNSSLQWYTINYFNKRHVYFLDRAKIYEESSYFYKLEKNLNISFFFINQNQFKKLKNYKTFEDFKKEFQVKYDRLKFKIEYGSIIDNYNSDYYFYYNNYKFFKHLNIEHEYIYSSTIESFEKLGFKLSPTYEKLLENSKKFLNPNNESYEGIYHYFFKKLKQKITKKC